MPQHLWHIASWPSAGPKPGFPARP